MQEIATDKIQFYVEPLIDDEAEKIIEVLINDKFYPANLVDEKLKSKIIAKQTPLFSFITGSSDNETNLSQSDKSLEVLKIEKIRTDFDNKLNSILNIDNIYSSET